MIAEDEGSEEPIEDLEAPAELQDDVGGGALPCMGRDTRTQCLPPTCKRTNSDCKGDSSDTVIVVYNQ